MDTIDYSSVFIADKLGYKNRPFTMLHRPVTSHDEYTLYMGKTIYDNDASLDWVTFVHEMTHVWQEQNHWISSGYMWNSAVSQIINGDSAYDYKTGGMWGEYNVEQQAHLVEDWCAKDGESKSSARFYYIKTAFANLGEPG